MKIILNYEVKYTNAYGQLKESLIFNNESSARDYMKSLTKYAYAGEKIILFKNGNQIDMVII